MTQEYLLNRAVAGSGTAGPPGRTRVPAVAVLSVWFALLLGAVLFSAKLELVWSDWELAFLAAAIWGLNALVLVYGIGGEFHLGRLPLTSALFSLVMTVVGSGSYWVTRILNPLYRVPIEKAAVLVALCTLVSLLATVVGLRLPSEPRYKGFARLEWDWPRLRTITLGLTILVVIATVISLKRIGYIPALTGDPTSERVEYPAMAGIWFRLSVLGGASALLSAAFICARRATVDIYLSGAVSLACLSVYGARFYVVFPLAVGLVLWDLVRRRVRLFKLGLVAVPLVMVLALLGTLRQSSDSIRQVSPLGAALYASFLEFRDLAWAMEYFSHEGRYLHGETLPSLIVPLLPAPAWTVVGVDKETVYEQNSANVMANAMGVDTGQRIGAYGEFFINFGWSGALIGAMLYGLLIAWIDRRARMLTPESVSGVFIAMASVATIFAQIGQLNMFTSTLTGLGYPLLLIVAVSSRQRHSAATAA